MAPKLTDIQLNVRPVFIAFIHQYAFEGPCRFGQGEQLEHDYDVMMAQELFKKFRSNIAKNTPEGINILEPIYVERSDWFEMKEGIYEEMSKDINEVDFFLFSTGIARGDLFLEFGERFGKPIGIVPWQCCGPFSNTAAARARGLEAYSFRNWDDFKTYMRVFRARKALQQTRVLMSARANSEVSLSTPDVFVNAHDVTRRLGVRLRYISEHELLDLMQPVDPSTNHTLPGRKACNINDTDLAEAEALADELIAGAQEVRMSREDILRTLHAYLTVKKVLEANDCNAFTMQCPDMCATRRFNEQRITPCMIHALNCEHGVPSACEYDLNALLAMVVLMNLSGKATYMGNVNCVYYDEEGKMTTLQAIGEKDITGVPEADKPNLYMTFHAAANRKLKGLTEPAAPYAISPFTYSGFGATFRMDFSADRGQEITLCRFAPDGKQLFVGKGIISAGFGYNSYNCDQGFFFTVGDQADFFYKHINFGNHLPLVYGDYTRELKLLGEILGFEVVTA